MMAPEELLLLRKDNNVCQNTPFSGEGLIYWEQASPVAHCPLQDAESALAQNQSDS